MHASILLRSLVVAALFLHPMARASEFFVSPSGDDANPGTLAKPWRTLLKINQAQLSPGDKVLLEGGRSFDGNLVASQRWESTSNRPILIGSFGEGRAIIRAGSGTGIEVRDLGGIIIRDVDVIGSGPNNRGFGIAIMNVRGSQRLDRVWVENVEASGFRWAGIYIGGVPGLPGFATELPHPGRYGFRNVKISRCTAHRNTYYGIYVSGPWTQYKADYANEDVSITDSVVYDNPGDPTYKENHSGNGILLDDTDGGLIEHCTAYNNGYANGSQQGGPVGIWTDESNAIVIQFCESYDNRTGGSADGGGFDLDGGVTNSIVQYNYSHGNDGAGYLVWNYWGSIHPLQNNTIRYNISANDGRKHHYGGVFVGGGGGTAVQELEVYNNTVFMKSGGAGEPIAAWVGGTAPNRDIHFRSNLLISDAGVPLVEVEPNQPSVLFQGNAYWAHGGVFTIKWSGKTYTALSAWESASGQEQLHGKAVGKAIQSEVEGIGSAPDIFGKKSLFDLAAYRLQADSPLIDAGLDLGKEFGIDVGTQDFWGTPIPQGNGFDIGACERGTDK